MHKRITWQWTNSPYAVGGTSVGMDGVPRLLVLVDPHVGTNAVMLQFTFAKIGRRAWRCYARVDVVGDARHVLRESVGAYIAECMAKAYAEAT